MKPLRALLVAGAIVCVAPSAASAQTGTISGIVKDSATRAPVEGVVVSIKGTSYGTSSRVNGAFAILGVPPGTYSVTARRFGYATREVGSVEVQIGRNQPLTIIIRASRADSTDRSDALRPPVESQIGAYGISLNRDQIISTPVLSAAGALAENGGYLALPRSSAVLSLADLERGVINLASVRGGRPDATQFLVDGIAVNNPVFGSPPLLIEPFADAGVTFSPSHVDAEHGGALSGLVEQAIRAGTARYSGAFEYQTSALAGALGSPVSRASGTNAARAYLAGPLPVFGDAVRFSVAGHLLDNQIFVNKFTDGSWRGSGGDQDDQIVAKLTYAVRPSLLWSVSAIGQLRRVAGIDPGVLDGDTIAQPAVHDDQRLVITRIEKRFARANVSLSLASNKEQSETCSIWQGVCVTDHLQRIPQGSEIPLFPVPRQTPYAASGQYFGNDTYATSVARADLVFQASDHHRIGIGVYSARHDIVYQGVTGYRWLLGTVLTSNDEYRANPREFSSYVEDAIEFDLVTMHIGARFDYGNAGGVAFTNPLDPTNGTTAREVCDGTAAGLSSAPFTYGGLSGIAACVESPPDATGRPMLLDSATRVAQRDDFRAVRPKATFSPRIGLSFPLTESSAIFVNYGRYSKEPSYHDMYRNTGTGTRAGFNGGDDGICDATRARPGTTECTPNLLLPPTVPEFVGNPNLNFEIADAFEAGFTHQIDPIHSLEASVFSNEQSFLPTISAGNLAPDIGLTYGVLSQGSDRTALSRGSISTTGLSITLRRRQQGAMSYTINYEWERSSEIGASPALVTEALAAGEVIDNTLERISPRIRTHTLNTQFNWQWRDQTPPELGAIGAVMLHNARFVVTASLASGSAAPDFAQSGCSPAGGCPATTATIGATGVLANVLYVRSLSTQGTRWALIVRVQNVFDADDGSAELFGLAARRFAAAASSVPRSGQQVSTRRILAGVSVDFQ